MQQPVQDQELQGVRGVQGAAAGQVARSAWDERTS